MTLPKSSNELWEMVTENRTVFPDTPHALFRRIAEIVPAVRFELDGTDIPHNQLSKLSTDQLDRMKVWNMPFELDEKKMPWWKMLMRAFAALIKASGPSASPPS